ncbi:MAG: hypothetical protein ACXWW9_08335 [Actinomycetota bacterium]
MDQTFNFRAAPVPLHRRLNPRAVALAVAAVLVLSGLVSFSRWVVDSERRSMDRAERVERTGSIVGTISGSDDALAAASPVADRLTIDATARADARVALDAARRAARGGATFLDAGPGHLTPLATSQLIFVDGPSRGPGVVSIASTRETWAAAVMGQSGMCYLLRFAPGDGVTYGTGQACTGDEALTARGAAW